MSNTSERHEESLYEQMCFTTGELSRRKQLVNLNDTELEALSSYSTLLEEVIDEIVESFYEHQLSFPEIAEVIGEDRTLANLEKAQKQYILDMFNGVIDEAYLTKRLRIGLAHKNINVPPKLYIASSMTLKNLMLEEIGKRVDQNTLNRIATTLEKIFSFDITLVFDSYLHSMLSDLESARHEAEEFARNVEYLSNIDPLTNLVNRRALSSFSRKLFNHSRRKDLDIAAILIDIDDFKSINDENGHKAGDHVLISMGRALRDNIRHDIDIACRYGGDEFLVLLEDCDQTGAGRLLKRVRDHFSRLCPGIRFSAGLASMVCDTDKSCDQLIHDADIAMYRDKLSRKPALDHPVL